MQITDDLKSQLTRSAYQFLRAQPVWAHAKSPELSHQRVLPFATYAPWLDDAAFIDIYEKIRNNTLVDIYRCHELWMLGRQMSHVPGAVLEVGVWRGGTGALLAKSVEGTGKRVFLADTFEGVVKAGALDTNYENGEHADTSEDIVNELIAACSLTNITLLKGIFPDDHPASIGDALSFVHCDVDVYASAREIVEWALPRLSTGGIIAFDDYGFHGCEGVTRLVNELRSHSALLFVHNLNGHALLCKVR